MKTERRTLSRGSHSTIRRGSLSGNVFSRAGGNQRHNPANGPTHAALFLVLFMLVIFTFIGFLNAPDQVLDLFPRSAGGEATQLLVPPSVEPEVIIRSFPRSDAVSPDGAGHRPRPSPGNGNPNDFIRNNSDRPHLPLLPKRARFCRIVTTAQSDSSARPIALIIGFNHSEMRSRVATMQALRNLLGKTRLRNIAFEFPSDLQPAFEQYCTSGRGRRAKERLALLMIDHYPASASMSLGQKEDCARKLLATQSILSLLDLADIAAKFKATVRLIDTPMPMVIIGDPKIPYRNRIMARNALKDLRGGSVVLLVGAVHTGHGDLGLSLDDRLAELGAKTLSVNVALSNVDQRREWGTNREGADFRITDPSELLALVEGRYPGM